MNKLLNNIKEFKNLLETITDEHGLNFLEVLELSKKTKTKELEPRLITMLNFHIEKTDKLIKLLYLDEQFLKIDIDLKLGLILREVTKILGALGGK